MAGGTYDSFKAHRFSEANRTSPVIYCGLDDTTCTYRLLDGSSWTFSRKEAARLGHPRWAHLEAAA
jgi:hypothetical protein